LLDDQGKKGTEVLAVAIDSKADLQKMADKIAKDGKAPNIVFLSDPDHRVIDRYGIWNPAGKRWPHPTTLVIDRQGIVRWKFVEIDYRVRPKNEQILEALGRLR
jgi:peroxiredoxin